MLLLSLYFLNFYLSVTDKISFDLLIKLLFIYSFVVDISACFFIFVYIPIHKFYVMSYIMHPGKFLKFYDYWSVKFFEKEKVSNKLKIGFNYIN